MARPGAPRTRLDGRRVERAAAAARLRWNGHFAPGAEPGSSDRPILRSARPEVSLPHAASALDHSFPFRSAPRPTPQPPWPAGATGSVALGDARLTLGAGTPLARFAGGARGGDRLAVNPARVLALLAVAGRPVPADRALAGIAAAAGHWARGDRALANIRFLFAGLPRLAAPADAERLAAAAALLDGGMAPRRLMAGLDLDTASLDEADLYLAKCHLAKCHLAKCHLAKCHLAKCHLAKCHLAKYSPDQPRVPAGNGAASGRWVGADGAFGLTGALRVSQLRFDAVQVAANGPFTDGGQGTSFTTPGDNPLDPHGLNKPTTAEERQALIDALNTLVEGRGSRPRKLNEKDYDNRPHPRTGAVLPVSPGNYKEYTVRTPDIFNHGERRLVTDWSNGNMYVSKNHYQSFYRFRIVPSAR